MSWKPVEIFVFFILPFIAAGVFRWLYLYAGKGIRLGGFFSVGAFVLWLFFDSPNAEVRMGVFTALIIIGVPTLIIAWLWPWLVKLVCFPYRICKRFFGKPS